ncbi:hypothetical protein, conserved [Plasmodium gonderi]|uniref:Uncharacterized protein n=1 Tax=Plasmodium gonderi TaxID=77519 RepID=A0A1Y1JHA5_PLAGO|nr:hypothetical protein, conserved [Plasmodium gonderi]GAW79464.1 hypothetical protein, conserved [Plasmodium gonderi]
MNLWGRMIIRLLGQRNSMNKYFLLSGKKASFSFHLQKKRDTIKETEESYNFEDALIRRISKMNNTALAHTCENTNKRRINNPYIWELVHDRIKVIRNSFSLNEVVVMFHAYCNSTSYDPKFTHLINLFWDILENKLGGLDYLSYIALYFCAEKTKDEKKMEEISTLLQKLLLNNDIAKMKITEKGLSIILKTFCYNNKKEIGNKHVKIVGELMQKVDVKEVGNIMLCLFFFFKHDVFDESFVAILKKVQYLLIFKQINPHVVLKCLRVTSKLSNNDIALQEVRNTLCIATLAHYITSGV